MNEQQLSDLLRNLPREEASVDFTDRVLERVGRPRTTRLWAVAASLVLLVLVGFSVREGQHRYEKQQTLAQLEQLRAEHEVLEKELTRLRELRDGQPVIYLGGDEEVEVVLGIDRVRRPRDTLDVRPASFTDL